MRALLLCILYFGLSSPIFSQTDEELAELIRISESYYGSNDALYYGKLYRISSRLATGHPFYKSQNYESAIIYIRGQKFEKIPCRLDLENDVLIARLSQNGINREVILSPAAVDSFYLNSALFINGKHIGPNFNFYYESITTQYFKIIKSYEKQFVAIYNQTHPRGRYGETTSKLLLIQNETAVDLSTNKKLLNHFFEIKPFVKLYLKTTKLNVKQASNEELQSLFKYIASIANSH